MARGRCTRHSSRDGEDRRGWRDSISVGNPIFDRDLLFLMLYVTSAPSYTNSAHTFSPRPLSGGPYAITGDCLSLDSVSRASLPSFLACCWKNDSDIIE